MKEKMKIPFKKMPETKHGKWEKKEWKNIFPCFWFFTGRHLPIIDS
jgi:hypothetical protein